MSRPTMQPAAGADRGDRGVGLGLVGERPQARGAVAVRRRPGSGGCGGSGGSLGHAGRGGRRQRRHRRRHRVPSRRGRSRPARSPSTTAMQASARALISCLFFAQALIRVVCSSRERSSPVLAQSSATGPAPPPAPRRPTAPRRRPSYPTAPAGRTGCRYATVSQLS